MKVNVNSEPSLREAAWAALAVAQQRFSALPPFVCQPLSCPALSVGEPFQVPSGHSRLDLSYREQTPAPVCACGETPWGQPCRAQALVAGVWSSLQGQWSSRPRQRPSQGPGTVVWFPSFGQRAPPKLNKPRVPWTEHDLPLPAGPAFVVLRLLCLSQGRVDQQPLRAGPHPAAPAVAACTPSVPHALPCLAHTLQTHSAET